MTFEDYLRNEIHPILHPQLLDDDMPDHFDNWLGDLDGQDYMEYAELYGNHKYLDGKQHVIDSILKKLSK